MPTRKEYAYYIKGNKVAIVQKDWASSGGQTLSQPALNDIGSVGALMWKSPIATVADGSFIVLRNAGKWNGLHKVSAAGADYINTYTKYSGTGAAIAFEETVTLYYNVDVLNDEADELDIPRYLANAVVYYVRAKYAEDAGQIDMKEYFMREFRRITEKHQSSKKWGTYRIQGFSFLR